MEDTSPEAMEVLIDGYRKMAPARKLHRVFDLSETLLLLARRRIVEEHGEETSEREIRLRLAALNLPRETMVRVFGFDPESEGH